MSAFVPTSTSEVPTSSSRQRSESPKKRTPSPDPDGLLEYSVVYTNRSLNHMSGKFQQVMKDISSNLKEVYGAHTAALVPGSGTFAMESVARQFATNQKCLVLRNGYFSYRWSQILEMGSIASEEIVMKGRPVELISNPAYAPCTLEEVSQAIHEQHPAVVFAPHVETSSGMILPDSYIKEVADAVHAVGGLFVLDCIASGCLWVDMNALGVDVLISAPQKGWSSSPCVGIVMLSKSARDRLDKTKNTVFALDLKKWVAVMEAYEQGGHMYHTTMPTDSIIRFRDVLLETKAYGFERARLEQIRLGEAVRRLLARTGFKSVAARDFAAPGVVVSYTSDPEMKSGAKFAALGLQIAAGVPLMLDDFTTSSPDFITFRLGLFGIDKLSKMQETIARLEKALVALTFRDGAPTSRF
jgi:aspartate aminotransferase-like enzyme